MDRESILKIGGKGCWQSALLVLLAVILGLVWNQVRPQGLVLVEDDLSPEGQIEGAYGAGMSLSLDEARELFFSGAAVFIDARAEALYRLGHILGARSVPPEALEHGLDAATADLAPDALIVTYCDGESCGLSWELALELINRGFSNVRVLVNGWTLWQEADLPLEAGPPVPAS